MDHLLDVHGEPLAPESIRMLEYLKARAAEMSVAQIRQRIRVAAQELEGVVAAVDPAYARQRPVERKWNIAEVVDPHLPDADPRHGRVASPSGRPASAAAAGV